MYMDLGLFSFEDVFATPTNVALVVGAARGSACEDSGSRGMAWGWVKFIYVCKLYAYIYIYIHLHQHVHIYIYV